MKDLKIVNGLVPDFDKDCFQEADVLIHEGVIEQVGCVSAETREVIDADGHIVAPGFLNIHAHEDAPDIFPFTAERELLMGVTTEIAGNCGVIAYPNEDFKARLDRDGAPCNFMMFIGQNSLREFSGITDPYQRTTPAQLDRMKLELSRLRKTVYPAGLSCGFEYHPAITTEETVELLTALEEEGYLTAVHFRADGADAPDSTRELVEISRLSGYPMQMSHIGSCSAFGYMQETLTILDQARADGVDIMADCYPYDAFCTPIGSAVFDEQQMKKRPYESILIGMGENAGKRCDRELFEYERREHPDYGVVCFAMNMDEVYDAFRHPLVMVGSDGGYMEGVGHPRGAGTFPKVLGKLARDEKVLSLMEALKKMTVMPAQRVHLYTKGQVREGFDADLVIFDPDTINDRAGYDAESCAMPPEGISRVLIGGKTVVKDNRIILNDQGRYLSYKNSK